PEGVTTKDACGVTPSGPFTVSRSNVFITSEYIPPAYGADPSFKGAVLDGPNGFDLVGTSSSPITSVVLRGFLFRHKETTTLPPSSKTRGTLITWCASCRVTRNNYQLSTEAPELTVPPEADQGDRNWIFINGAGTSYTEVDHNAFSGKSTK